MTAHSGRAHARTPSPKPQADAPKPADRKVDEAERNAAIRRSTGGDYPL